MVARKYEELFNMNKEGFIKLLIDNIIEELSKGFAVTVVLYSQNPNISELEQSVVNNIIKILPHAIDYINIINN